MLLWGFFSHECRVFFFSCSCIMAWSWRSVKLFCCTGADCSRDFCIFLMSSECSELSSVGASSWLGHSSMSNLLSLSTNNIWDDVSEDRAKIIIIRCFCMNLTRSSCPVAVYSLWFIIFVCRFNLRQNRWTLLDWISESVSCMFLLTLWR